MGGVNTNNLGNKRKKNVCVALSEDEWQKLVTYGTHYGLSPTAASRRLINEGLLFHQ
jgi:phage terminase small subunit